MLNKNIATELFDNVNAFMRLIINTHFLKYFIETDANNLSSSQGRRYN